MKPILEKLNQNKTEAAYDEVLRRRKLVGEILDYRFEPMKLILAHNVTGRKNEVSYKPDFLVIHKDYFEFIEVKAKRGKWTSMRDDARAKINIAADLYPFFRWTVVYAEGGNWTHETL